MKAKKLTFTVLLTLLFIFVATGYGQKTLNKPHFPPQEWQVWLDIDFSEDIVFQILNKKPSPNEFYVFDNIDFIVDSDCSLYATRKHPVLTGKLKRYFSDGLLSSPISFIPVADQKTIYQHCFEAIEAFDFKDKFEYSGYNVSGIDISLKLEVNGRSIDLKYQKIQQEDSLPQPILRILSLIRRNLPSKFNQLFDFLRVPKLPPLPPEIRNKYSKCKIHHEFMKVDTAKILYGDFLFDEEFCEAQTNLFPNANTQMFSGFEDEEIKKGKVLFCESCRAAEKKWLKENDITFPK